MHHPALAMLLADVRQVGLRPEQQTSVDTIQADLEKETDALKEPRTQLSNDLADGVAAGKLDKSKIEGDSKKLAQAAESTAKAVQDAANKLHATLDASQRKKLIELMREKAQEMQAHAMGHTQGPTPERHGMGPRGDMPGAGKSPGSAASAVPTSSASAGSAQTPAGAAPRDVNAPGMGPKGDQHMGMHHHGAGPHEMGPAGWQTHMGIDRLGDILGLTQEQREKLRTKAEAHMKAQMSAMKNVHAAMQKRIRGIADAFASDKFDAKKAGVAEKHGEMMKNMLKARVEFVEMVLSVLTPEQRAKFAEHIRQHCEVCDEKE